MLASHHQLKLAAAPPNGGAHVGALNTQNIEGGVDINGHNQCLANTLRQAGKQLAPVLIEWIRYVRNADSLRKYS